MTVLKRTVYKGSKNICITSVRRSKKLFKNYIGNVFTVLRKKWNINW